MPRSADDEQAYVKDCALQLQIMAETLRVLGGAGFYAGLNGKGRELVSFGDRIDPIAVAMVAFADAPPQMLSPATIRRNGK